MSNKIIPITRINKFFSSEDYNLEVSMAREFIEGDGNFKIVLYRVDREMTPTDIYNEARKNEVMYKSPVEVSVMPVLEEAENITFNKGGGSLRDLQDGKFTFSVYQAHLDELGVDISFGDYVGYAVSETEVRYFSVVNDGTKFYDNKHTIFGYKGAFRTVSCAAVDGNEFSGN